MSPEESHQAAHPQPLGYGEVDTKGVTTIREEEMEGREEGSKQLDS